MNKAKRRKNPLSTLDEILKANGGNNNLCI